MACYETGTVVDLAAREVLTLDDVRGVTLRVTRGTVWITQERDLEDIVLRAGNNWVVECSGRTVIEANEAASICAVTKSAGTRWMPLTPFVFCAVNAVMTEAP